MSRPPKPARPTHVVSGPRLTPTTPRADEVACYLCDRPMPGDHAPMDRREPGACDECWLTHLADDDQRAQVADLRQRARARAALLASQTLAPPPLTHSQSPQPSSPPETDSSKGQTPHLTTKGWCSGCVASEHTSHPICREPAQACGMCRRCPLLPAHPLMPSGPAA